jgi:hypothetical protein
MVLLILQYTHEQYLGLVAVRLAAGGEAHRLVVGRPPAGAPVFVQVGAALAVGTEGSVPVVPVAALPPGIGGCVLIGGGPPAGTQVSVLVVATLPSGTEGRKVVFGGLPAGPEGCEVFGGLPAGAEEETVGVTDE